MNARGHDSARTAARPGATRRVRRRLPSRLSAVATRILPDLLALLALGCGLVALLLFVATLPPTSLTTALERPAAGIGLYDFYGTERNADGFFRWSKPQAEILVPINRPGLYRVILTLQDSPAVGTPRTVTLRLAGGSERTVQLDATARDFSIDGSIDRNAWLNGQQRALDIQLETNAAKAPGDPRPLGVIVSRVMVAPVKQLSPWDPALFSIYLLLLPISYGTVRLVGAPTRHAVGGVGALLAGGAFLAIGARPLAFRLAYLPIARPIALLGLALLAAPLPLVRRSWVALVPEAMEVRSMLAGDLDATPDTRFWSRHSWPLVPVALLALAVRLDGLNRLSMWLDEGFTVLYARLPWVALLGLQGQYDVHPPLYYVVTKLATLVVPEVAAGRLVSAFAGAATVPVLYALAARLLDRWAALATATVLTLSPLHVWYSQEARMYSMAVLLIAFTYLALVAFGRDESMWWAAGYGVAVLLALYTDFSVAYALAPQVFLLVLITRRRGWHALALWGMGTGAVLLFCPWLMAAVAPVGGTANRQASFLGVSLRKILESLLAIGGLSGESSYYWGPVRTTWARWPALHGSFLLAVMPAIVVSTVALIRRRPVAAITTTALLVGTIGTATSVSVLNPGYADRTVLYATLGWGLLVGAAPFAAERRGIRLAGTASLIAILILSTLSLGAIKRDAVKQDYRALAVDAARVSGSGLPLLTDGKLTDTFLDVYEPRIAAATRLSLEEPRVEERLAGLDAFWFAYANYPWNDLDVWRQRIGALGYARIAHQPYANDTLFLDLYARPGVQLGTPLPLTSATWCLPMKGTRLALRIRFPDRGEDTASVRTVRLGDGRSQAGPGVSSTVLPVGLRTME